MSTIGPPYVGRSLLRREDRRLLTGQGQFIADLVLPRMLHAVFAASRSLLSISGAQADILAVETQQIEQKEHQAGRVAEMLLAVIASIAVRSRLAAGGRLCGRPPRVKGVWLRTVMPVAGLCP